MIKHETLSLQLSDEQTKELKTFYRDVIEHLEKGFPLKLSVLENFKSALSEIVNTSTQWQDILQAVNDSGDFYCLHLLHSDNEILNLPWSMAVDNISQNPLGQVRRLILAKGIPRFFKEKTAAFFKVPAPLKVLIMISSPVDTEHEKRLSYEEEEFEILNAFEPLMQSGQVEVDFTEDGSLEALERKLKTNWYHILHFSGHANFNEEEKTGYLHLENPLNMKSLGKAKLKKH